MNMSPIRTTRIFLSVLVLFITVAVYLFLALYHISLTDYSDITVSIYQTLDDTGISGILGLAMPTYMVINPKGSFLERVEKYNIALTRVRREIWMRRGNKTWEAPQGKEAKILILETARFVENMTSHSDVIGGVVLKWSNRRESGEPNMLLTKYYKWASVDAVCDPIRKGTPKRFPYHTIFNYTCYSDKDVLEKPQDILPISINRMGIHKPIYWPVGADGRLEESFSRPPNFVFYTHILQDCYVTSSSDVFTRHLKIVPDTCRHNHSLQYPGDMNQTRLYDEILVVTQFWGMGFFHGMVEVIPRVAPYKKFLAENTEVKILVYKKEALISKALNISIERQVTGPVRAKIAYLPRGTPCGTPRLQETQLLSHHYRQYIQTNITTAPRNRLVLIKRTLSRYLTNHTEIVKDLQRLAKQYKLEFSHWTDVPSLSMREAMRMFNEAVMVVAPHGAGEANLLFSRPGTYVIEVVCQPPQTNLCYQRLAEVLGLRYFALMGSSGCPTSIDISLKELRSTVTYFLDMWKRTG